jgi:hypothetical protein
MRSHSREAELRGQRSHAGKERLTGKKSEHAHQRDLAALLDTLLPDGAFWFAIDNKPRSRTTGAINRLVGIRRGVPDIEVFHNGKAVFIELKRDGGTVSPAQREVHARLKTAGIDCWVAHSPRAALVALLRSGIPLREGWNPPLELAAWEGPFSEPPPRRDSAFARPADEDKVKSGVPERAPTAPLYDPITGRRITP